MPGEEMIPIVIVPVIFGVIGWIAWSAFNAIRRFKIAKLQAEVQTRLLDRFGSSQDLLAYAQTEAGRHFLDSLSVERSSAYGRIIGAIQTGIILLFFGLALFLLRNRVYAWEVFLVFGTLMIALGVGFALSGIVSYYLSKHFGLLKETAGN